MIVKRRNGEVAKVLTVIYALLWIAVIIICLIAKTKDKSTYVDLSGIFIIFANIAGAGFLTTVLAFTALLKYYNRKSGYLVIQRAAVICAFAAGVSLIISAGLIITWWGAVFCWAVAGVLSIVSFVLLIISSIDTKKPEEDHEQ